MFPVIVYLIHRPSGWWDRPGSMCTLWECSDTINHLILSSDISYVIIDCTAVGNP